MREARGAGPDHLGGGLEVAYVGREEGAPGYGGLAEFEDYKLSWPENNPGTVG